MAANAQKSVVIQANSNNKNWKTVNIVAGVAPTGKKNHTQIPLAQNTLHQFPIYQPSAGSINGLQTIYISGYTGPA
jgi:hypothetical protein